MGLLYDKVLYNACAVIGCADVEVPSHVTFERRGPGGGVLRCKDSGAEANVTCQGNTWLGDTVNCSQGAFCFVLILVGLLFILLLKIFLLMLICVCVNCCVVYCRCHVNRYH